MRRIGVVLRRRKLLPTTGCPSRVSASSEKPGERCPQKMEQEEADRQAESGIDQAFGGQGNGRSKGIERRAISGSTIRKNTSSRMKLSADQSASSACVSAVARAPVDASSASESPAPAACSSRRGRVTSTDPSAPIPSRRQGRAAGAITCEAREPPAAAR
jgi:hypothetical protein